MRPSSWWERFWLREREAWSTAERMGWCALAGCWLLILLLRMLAPSVAVPAASTPYPPLDRILSVLQPVVSGETIQPSRPQPSGETLGGFLEPRTPIAGRVSQCIVTADPAYDLPSTIYSGWGGGSWVESCYSVRIGAMNPGARRGSASSAFAERAPASAKATADKTADQPRPATEGRGDEPSSVAGVADPGGSWGRVAVQLFDREG